MKRKDQANEKDEPATLASAAMDPLERGSRRVSRAADVVDEANRQFHRLAILGVSQREPNALKAALEKLAEARVSFDAEVDEHSLARGAIRVASAAIRQRNISEEGGRKGRGKLKGPLQCFVMALVEMGVRLKPEAIQRVFAACEDGLSAQPGRLQLVQEKALGLLMRANARLKKPLAVGDGTIGLDERNKLPTIRYRVEGSSILRTCTDHNLKTYVIPAVQKALTQRK